MKKIKIMLEACDVVKTTNKRLKNKPRSPPPARGLMSLSVVVLLGNIVFQEFHLNNYGGKRKKIKITLEVCDVVQTTNKHQLKTNLDPPPALVVTCAIPRAQLLSGREVI